MKFGAQFFSIRNHTQTPEELYNAFKTIKGMGYSIAQMSAICKMDPYVLKSYIDATCYCFISIFYSFCRQ